MDFRQLEAFCAIVEWGSFSEASKHLFITQPTISSHIQALEKNLHTDLLDCTTKPVTLTEEGKRFYASAKDLLRLKEKVLRDFENNLHHIIQFGSSSIPSAYVLPEIMSAYHELVPETIFNVVQADSSDILQQIRAGSLDVGITGLSLSEEHYSCTAIYRDEMVLATPATEYYLRLKKQKVPLTRLLQEPYLVREDGSGTKKAAEQFLKAINLTSSDLNIVARMNDLEAIKQSIIYGLGISILSKKVTDDLKKANRLIIYPLAKGGVYRNYYLIYNKNVIQNKQLKGFIRFVENFYEQDKGVKTLV